jgi:peptidyl-prolyl cis-trans isomerase D
MSIIQTIRDKYAAVVIGVIALSLIAFVMMDAGKANRNSAGGRDDEAIAVVNGQKIPFSTYTEKSKQIEDYYASQGQTVNDNIKEQISQGAWSQITDGTVLDQEAAKVGLALTDKETGEALFGDNAPDFIKQAFGDPKTHEYNGVQAAQQFAQLKKRKEEPQIKAFIENQINPFIENIVKRKYFTLLQQSSFVPSWLAQKQLADNNAIANFQYVNMPYSAIADSTIKISDDQINSYVKDHANEYKLDDATRGISYVVFNIAPTGADSAATLKAIADLKPGCEAAKDAGVFVGRNGTDNKFYDAYVAKSKMMMPAKDSIMAAGIGKVYGPYLDGNEWSLSKIIDIKNMPDSVKARHILIGTVDPQTHQPKMDDATAKAKIDSIYKLVKAGGNFAQLAMQLSDDEGSKVKGGDLGYFAQGQMVPEFNDSCFMGKTGDFKIVHSQFGYHLINIEDQKGFQPAYKVAYMAKPIEAGSETRSDISNKASMFAGNSKDYNTFKENATKNNYNPLVANDIKEADYKVGMLGVSRELVRFMYDNKPGTVSPVIDMTDKLVVAVITNADEAGLPSAAHVRMQVEPILRNKEKAKQIIAKIGSISSLDALAAAQHQKVNNSDSTSFVNGTVNGMGFEPKVVGYAFNKAALNKISPAIEGNTGVVVLMASAIAAKQSMQTIDAVQKQMEGQMKQSLGYTAISGLRKAANIKDNRSKFL